MGYSIHYEYDLSSHQERSRREYHSSRLLFIVMIDVHQVAIFKGSSCSCIWNCQNWAWTWAWDWWRSISQDSSAECSYLFVSAELEASMALITELLCHPRLPRQASSAAVVRVNQIDSRGKDDGIPRSGQAFIVNSLSFLVPTLTSKKLLLRAGVSVIM